MKLKKRGTNTSKVEVTQISKNGLWLFVKNSEYFLPYEKFPWFEDATVAKIHDVKLLHGKHLYWKSLDIDLELESLKDPARYSLIYSK